MVVICTNYWRAFLLLHIYCGSYHGVFSIIESTAGNFEVEFKKSRKTAVTIATSIMMALAALFCMGNGQYLIGAIDPMVSGFNMLISGIAEIICFMWISHTIDKHKIWFTASGKRSIIYYCVRYIIPVLLILVFITAMMQELGGAIDYTKIIRWAWLIIASGIAFLLASKRKYMSNPCSFKSLCTIIMFCSLSGTLIGTPRFSSEQENQEPHVSRLNIQAIRSMKTQSCKLQERLLCVTQKLVVHWCFLIVTTNF